MISLILLTSVCGHAQPCAGLGVFDARNAARAMRGTIFNSVAIDAMPTRPSRDIFGTRAGRAIRSGGSWELAEAFICAEARFSTYFLVLASSSQFSRYTLLAMRSSANARATGDKRSRGDVLCSLEVIDLIAG